jgi:hypothetical protein
MRWKKSEDVGRNRLPSVRQLADQIVDKSEISDSDLFWFIHYPITLILADFF